MLAACSLVVAAAAVVVVVVGRWCAMLLLLGIVSVGWFARKRVSVRVYECRWLCMQPVIVLFVTEKNTRRAVCVISIPSMVVSSRVGTF